MQGFDEFQAIILWFLTIENNEYRINKVQF